MTKHSNVIDELLDDFAEAAAADDDFEHDPARGLENYLFAIKEAIAALATELVRMMVKALPEPNPREWANNLPQVAWTIGFEKAITETRTRLTAIIERELEAELSKDQEGEG